MWSARTRWAENLAILLAGLYGFWNWPWWIGIIVPSLMLWMLGWPHWRELAAKAWEMDAHWRVLGMYWRGHNLSLVVGGHLLRSRGRLLDMKARLFTPSMVRVQSVGET